MRFKVWYIFLLILLLIPAMAFAQHKELAVQRQGQRSGLWCWTASMDMVMNYHRPAASPGQCALVEQFMRMAGISNSADCSDYCLNPCSNPTPTTYPANCNVAIPHSYYLASNTKRYERAYIDLLFTENGFFSMEDHMKLTWDQYVYEIDHCRPVLFLYLITGENTVTTKKKTFPHVAVGKGYTTLSGSDATPMGNYFMVEDPWEVCHGEPYLLHENALTGQAVDAVEGVLVERMNGFLSMVHHIFPKTNTCDPCEAIPSAERYVDPRENILLTNIRRHSNQLIATNEGATFREERIPEYMGKERYQTKIEYLSYDNFNKIRNVSGVSYSNFLVKADVREITYTNSNPALITRVRCSNETSHCAIEKIGLSAGNSSKKVLVKGKTLLLSNDPKDKENSELELVPYSIVRFPPYTFEFYRFPYQGEMYFLPVEGSASLYFYGGKFQNAINGIPESYFLKGLHRYVQNYDQEKLFEKPRRFQEKARKLFENRGFLKMPNSQILKGN